MEIELLDTKAPEIHNNLHSVTLTKSTVDDRRKNLLEKMKVSGIDSVIIYADREHGANFEYLTGFIPRFEEACLVLHADGKSSLLLGNENLKMAQHSRIESSAIHVPFFSLPNQPMEGEELFENYFHRAGLRPDSKIGVIGWKLFTAKKYSNRNLFDIPFYIIDSLRDFISNNGSLVNFTSSLISPEDGIRTINNANEIAHYEYGATLAGAALFSALEAIEVGKSEKEIAGKLAKDGQPNSVTTICASGERFANANLYPADNILNIQDKFSITVGYKGGLSSRVGFIVSCEEELPSDQADYLDRVARPYFSAYITWLETIRIGLTADEMYNVIETVLPKEKYGWSLNPGHLTADEEWLSSPFFKNSTASVKSGQIYQIDIIPSVKGYAGVSCEEPVAIADEKLRQMIRAAWPEMWQRIELRRKYLKEVINIRLHDEVLPLSDTVAFLRPFLLNRKLAFVKK